MQLLFMTNTAPQKKIRLVFALPSFLFGGGIEKQLIKMLALFDRERFELSLLTLFEYPGRPNMYDDLPSDVAVIRLAFKNPFDVGSWLRLYQALKRIRPDIVVSSMFSASTPIRIVKPFVGYRVIVREHNTYTDKKLYHRIFEYILSYLSDAIIAVSSSVADFAAEQAWIPRKKIAVIHNGVDFDVIQRFCTNAQAEIERVRHEFSIASSQKILLNVARLKPQKDHELLIKSFTEFHTNNPDYVLMIAGDGSERRHLEQMIDQYDLAGSVFLLGHRSDIYAFYAASECFILTSRHEGFPNVGIEAMAFGLPFISTLVPGVDEFLEDGINGFLISSDVTSVVGVMNRVVALSSEERKQISRSATETARRFDIVRTVSQYQNLIETLCRS